MSLPQLPKQYRLTTAEILYRLPDHPVVLQSFIWQELDLAPAYPALRRFLAFWEREIEGRLHSVRVGSLDLVAPHRIRVPGAVLTLQ